MVTVRIALTSGFFSPFSLKNKIFFNCLVTSTEILILTISQRHSPFTSMATSPSFAIFSTIFYMVLMALHIRGTLRICTQNETCEKICLVMSPIPLGFFKTMRTLSKCQSPPTMTLCFSSSEANLNMKILLPKLSIFTSFIVLHACWRAILSPSLLTPLLCNFFPTKHLATTFALFFLMLLTKVILFASSDSDVISWHCLINSPVCTD